MADSQEHSKEHLEQIKARLREGKLTSDDVRNLEQIVVKAEQAIKNLRAAVVE